MNKLLSILALGSIMAPVANMSVVNTAQTKVASTAEKVASTVENVQTNSQELKILNLSANKMVGHYECNYFDGNIVPFDKLQNGTGDMFCSPTCEEARKEDGGRYIISLNTNGTRQSERVLNQGYTLDLELPANSNYNLKLNFNGSMQSYTQSGSRNGPFDAAIQLFNLGDSEQNHPEFFTNHNWEKKSDNSQADEKHVYCEKSSDRKFDSLNMTTNFDLSNPTDKPIKVSRYFSLSMFLGGYEREILNFGAFYSAYVNFNIIDTNKNLSVLKCKPNGMLGYYEHNYYDGNSVPFEKLQGGCGGMFNDPICELNNDGTYHINFSTKDKRQSERVIHQGYTLDLEIPAHSNFDLEVDLIGALKAYSQNKSWFKQFKPVDISMELFNLGDSCHNHPNSLSNYNWDKYFCSGDRDDEIHFYSDNKAGPCSDDPVWDNQKLSTSFNLVNDTDKPITVKRYFSISMFLGGYEREIRNFGAQFDGRLYFNIHNNSNDKYINIKHLNQKLCNIWFDDENNGIKKYCKDGEVKEWNVDTNGRGYCRPGLFRCKEPNHFFTTIEQSDYLNYSSGCGEEIELVVEVAPHSKWNVETVFLNHLTSKYPGDESTVNTSTQIYDGSATTFVNHNFCGGEMQTSIGERNFIGSIGIVRSSMDEVLNTDNRITTTLTFENDTDFPKTFAHYFTIFSMTTTIYSVLCCQLAKFKSDIWFNPTLVK